MKNYAYKSSLLKTALAGIILGACSILPAVADDIEIYTSLGPSAVVSNPNIMFLVDSSVSMASTSRIKNYYDAGITYAGACLSGSIYFTASGSFPDCATSTDYFDATANTCDHSVVGYNADGTKVTPGQDGSLLQVGTYSDQLAQYDPVGEVWRGLSTATAAERAYKVECKSDSGIHGESTGGNQTYINNTGGWTNAVPSDPANPHPIWYNSANNVQLFSGNYMNYVADPGADSGGAVSMGDVSFIEQVKHAVEVMVRGNTRVDIGLMRFDGANSEGGAVLYPILDVGADRNDFFTRLQNKVDAQGYTPLSETYYEAMLYFGGKDVDYGKLASPSNQTGTTESGNPTAYETPITSQCDLNYIVVLSDGSPTNDVLSATRQANLPGFNASYSCNAVDDGDILNDIDNNCMPKLASWAFTDDVATRADIVAHDGFQNIITHTIGFGDIPDNAKALLQATADSSEKGEYYLAQSEADLIAAFNDIIAGILAQNSTFSSPAVSVNAFNRATNLEDLYFTLFKPADGEHWEGNLKKFKLEFNAGLPVVADKNSVPAIDTATGFFKESSVSYWTEAADSPDGAETAKGGAASRIVLPRKTYTYAGTYSGTAGVLTPSDGDLTSTANGLNDTNTGITDAMLGGVAANPPVLIDGEGEVTYREALLRWSYGEDIKDADGDLVASEVRREMGDPLHAEPALVQYGMTAGGVPDLVAYVATNDGYLHAFDTVTGVENFTFVPQEMLPKLQNIFDDTGVNGKAYGLDGNVVSWINDADRNGTISGADEHVYLYFGMRRGGRFLYSMDVTDRNNPKLRWVLEGGTGDYAEMGQTWSAPNVENIKMGDVERTVLIFGAGYDTGQDVLLTRGTDSVGRGIFIVDAKSGKLLWRAGPDGGADLQLTNMLYSIPARITPIDVDGDGYTERLYAGDMGGQLWRIDINNTASTSSVISATGGRIADLAIDGSVNHNRRFYNSPDAALILEEGKAPYISIVAASGYRAHPLQTDTYDRAYMIRDHNVYDVPATYTTLTEADLFDTTDNAIGEGTQLEVDAAKLSLSGAQGWYITFNEMDGTYVGEKALSEPLILDGVAVFTTFIPASAGLTSSSCKANDGTGAIYFVNVVDGTPTRVYKDDGSATREDRRILLARGGIPPTPRVIITKDGIPTLCVGTECSKAGEVGTTQKMYWYEVEE
ncbi:MAG: PilC/PilY family type IV pilus protein [Gammaproteobacteria bacterium]|nr:PilC/PilY family type IV pilus protein [Gammaproteobacteria bacterium]